MTASTKEEIIKAIEKIKKHLLPEGQSLNWHDDKMENDLKQIIEAYEVLKENASELQDAQKRKVVDWLASFLPTIYRDYQHETVDELRNVTTDQIDGYLIKIVGWFDELIVQ